MRKKLLTLFTALFAVVTCAFGLAACNVNGGGNSGGSLDGHIHEHYLTADNGDGTHSFWCWTCKQPYDREAHDYGAGICKKCGAIDGDFKPKDERIEINEKIISVDKFYLYDEESGEKTDVITAGEATEKLYVALSVEFSDKKTANKKVYSVDYHIGNWSNSYREFYYDSDKFFTQNIISTALTFNFDEIESSVRSLAEKENREDFAKESGATLNLISDASDSTIKEANAEALRAGFAEKFKVTTNSEPLKENLYDVDYQSFTPFTFAEYERFLFYANDIQLPITREDVEAAYADAEDSNITLNGDGVFLDGNVIENGFKAHKVVAGVKYELHFRGMSYANYAIDVSVDDFVDAYYFGNNDTEFHYNDKTVNLQLKLYIHTDADDPEDEELIDTYSKQYVISGADRVGVGYTDDYTERVARIYDRFTIFGLYVNSSFQLPIHWIQPESVSFTVPAIKVDYYAQINPRIELCYPNDYKSVVNYSSTKCTVGGQTLNQYIETLSVADSPKQIDFKIKIDTIEMDCSTTVVINESIDARNFNNTSYIIKEYFEGDEFEYDPRLKVVEYYYDSFAAAKLGPDGRKKRELPFTADMLEGFSTDKSGEYTCKLAGSYSAFDYNVKVNSLVSIEPKFDIMFGGIILGEPIDLTDCYLTATYAKGNTEKIDMTADMISGYTQTPGEQEVTISYGGVTANANMTVRQVSGIKVYEGLDKYYLLGDSPAFDVWLDVTFTDDERDFVRVPAEKFASFDLSSTGSKTFELSYGGASCSFVYNVIDGVYITYTSNNNEITLDKFALGKPAEGTLAWIPEKVTDIVLPSEIDGVPVTKLAANLFKGQSILKSLVVPSSVKSIGYGLVDGCSNLCKLTLNGDIQLQYCFAKYKASTMISKAVYPDIPQNLEVVISGASLCDSFFADLYCSNTEKYVAKLTLGSAVTSFGVQDVYEMQSVKKLTDGGSETVWVKDDVVYSDGGATLTYYSFYKTAQTFVIPENVTAANIGQNDNLIRLEIHANVERLGEDFLRLSENLETVTIASGSKITELPDGAFGTCRKLTNFSFPEKLEKIGQYVLTDCAMDKIIIPKTVTEVRYGAFNGAQCTYFYIPSGATSQFADASKSPMWLKKLKYLAYDGTESVFKLNIFDSSSLPSIELYITGEVSQISDKWYSNYASTKVSKVYVCKGTNFSPSPYSASKVVYESSGSFVKWWLN